MRDIVWKNLLLPASHMHNGNITMCQCISKGILGKAEIYLSGYIMWHWISKRNHINTLKLQEFKKVVSCMWCNLMNVAIKYKYAITKTHVVMRNWITKLHDCICTICNHGMIMIDDIQHLTFYKAVNYPSTAHQGFQNKFLRIISENYVNSRLLWNKWNYQWLHAMKRHVSKMSLIP